MRVKIIVDDSHLNAALRRKARAVNARNMKIALLAGAFVILNKIRALAPYLTGVLRRSLHIGGFSGLSGSFGGGGGQFTDLGGEKIANGFASVIIGTNLIYARIHEFGGIIVPKTARLLSWVDRLTGRRIFAKRVTIKAQPYMRPGFNQGRQGAKSKMRNVLKKLVVDS